MLMVAMLTDRVFQMSKRGFLPSLESAFLAPNLQWSRPADPDWTLEPLRETAVVRNYNLSIQESHSYYAVNLISDNRLYDNLLRNGCPFLHASESRDTVFTVNNRGRIGRMFENPAYKERLIQMGLTPRTAFGCLLNYLIQPRPEIFLPVFDQFTAMTDPDPGVLKISIHIRAGDHVLLPESRGEMPTSDAYAALEHYHWFFTCAAQIEEWVLADAPPGKYRKAVWYLASDSHAIRRAAVDIFGAEKVVTSLDCRIEHTSKENFDCGMRHSASDDAARQSTTSMDSSSDSARGSPVYGTPRPHGPGSQDLHTTCPVSDEGFNTAAAEWWMLGYADYHVVTLSSGYGRAGAFRTGNRNNIYTIYRDQETLCDREGYTRQEQLIYDWSGI